MNLDQLFPLPKLQAGETIRETWMVNRTQGFRAVGGRLYLTDRRLAFVPHVVDSFFHADPRSLDLDKITAVTTEPGEVAFAHLFDGGLRDRLRIESTGSEPDFYVINNLEKVMETLSAAVDTAKTAPVF
jgi:hypothetical protein